VGHVHRCAFASREQKIYPTQMELWVHLICFQCLSSVGFSAALAS